MTTARPNRRRALALVAGGGLLVCVAALTSNRGIEEAFGRAPGSLAWGPALFRLLLVFHGLALTAAAFVRQDRNRDLEPPAPTTARWHWIALAALAALALGLRLWRLDSSLWFDEVLTLLDFVRPPLAIIVTSFSSQSQHMLYSLLAHASIRLFGENAAALRLPAVLFGVAGVWALFLLGRRILGASQALLACALMTVSYHHIWFSQNARGYTGLLFFAMLATWLWLEAPARRSWRWWIAYSLAVALGMWTHMTMLFVVIAHVLAQLPSLLRREESRLQPLAAWLLGGAFTLQLYALTLPEFLRTTLHEISPPSQWTDPLWALGESLRGLQAGWSGAAVVALGGLVLLGGWLGIWSRHRRAALALLLPGLLGGAAMLASGHNLWPRFFFFSMGFALLAVVHGASTLPRLALARFRGQVFQRLGQRSGVALAGLLIAASALTIPRCYALPKQDFTAARDYVERNRKPSDEVVTVGLAARAYGGYFAPHWPAANSGPELDQMRRRHKSLWLVYTLPAQLQGFHPEIWRAVGADFEVVKVFPGTLGGGEITICRAKPQPPPQDPLTLAAELTTAAAWKEQAKP